MFCPEEMGLNWTLLFDVSPLMSPSWPSRFLIGLKGVDLSTEPGVQTELVEQRSAAGLLAELLGNEDQEALTIRNDIGELKRI
jgi:hypothetical protein